MRRRLLALAAALAVVLPLKAEAQVPGDACTEANVYAISAGPESTGAGYFMVCQGGIWRSLLSFNNTAQVTRIGDQTCSNTQILKFNGTTWACAADNDAAETDPQVGTLTATKWCAANVGGTVIDCTQDYLLPPCPNGDTLVSSAGGWICSSDQAPNSFSFNDLTGQIVATLVTSNIVQITGLSSSVSTSVTGQGAPQYRVCSDSGCSSVLTNWTNGSSTILNNQYVQMRLTTSGANLTMVSATMHVGSGNNQWDVTTAACNSTTVFLTTPTGSNGSWTVPANWNSSNNTIHAIGAGGGGHDGSDGGGGGGAYSSVSNLSLTPGANVTYRIAASSAAATTGGDTFFNRTSGSTNTCSDASSVCAKGGAGATSSAGATGGASASGIGTTKNAGGKGGNATGTNGGGGGGGAAGPNGAGGAAGDNGAFDGGSGGGGANGGGAGSAGLAINGGSGGNNRLGSGGGAGGAGTGGNGNAGGGGAGGAASFNGGNGSTDAIWTQTSNSATAGPGGGAGANGDGATAGGTPGQYGGGGAGGDGATGGGQGIVVVTYLACS